MGETGATPQRKLFLVAAVVMETTLQRKLLEVAKPTLHMMLFGSVKTTIQSV